MTDSRSLEYPSTEESIEQMLDDLNVLLDDSHVTAEERNAFLLAVSEAFTNAIVHGNGLKPGKEVKLTLRIKENELSADILDEGQKGLEQIRQRKPSAPMDEGGRGIDLIEHYATAVGYMETDTGGLRVSIRVSRKTETCKENI